MNEAELFSLAIEIEDSNARDSFLTKSCGSDWKLRQRIDRLLRAADTEDAFLETPVLDRTSVDRNACNRIAIGDSIGPYTLVDSLGEGGMGTVFLAEQKFPIHRRVAIKVIKQGMDSEQVIARFDTERQALSIMNHPNIARAFEAGATNQGRPYFVMEFVNGTPIVQYCDERRFNIRQRLELFVPVCEAVQHAHQKGIIHRDLKPSNILVSEIEKRSVPKIIDFGIAKAVNDPANAQPNLTQFGQIVGTMEYMSPEQSCFNPFDVDTRSDIYSLGVLLFELIAGSTPIQVHRLKNLAWDELARLIRDEDPVAPSARLLGDANQKAICELRRLTPAQSQRSIRGELDWIVLKALSKDRARRYQSASDMAKDIHRYLCNEPIEASPPSTAYRAKKYMQRNRFVIGSAAMVTSALLLGLAGTTWQAREASRERAAAELQRDIARAESKKAYAAESRAEKEAASVLKQSEYSRAIANFINHHLLEFTDPNIEPDRNISLRTVLDRAAFSIQELNAAPETQAAIRHTLAKSYLSLGEYAEARSHADAAIELQKSVLGDTHPDRLATLFLRAEIQLRCCEYRKANEAFTHAVNLSRNSLGNDHVLTLNGVRGQGICLAKLGRLLEASDLFQELVRAQTAALGENHRDTLETRRELAEVVAAMGRHHEAIDAFNAIRRIALESLGEAHPLTLKIDSGIASSTIELGQYDHARTILQSIVDSQTKSLGEKHPETIVSRSTLASISLRQGKLEESALLQRKLLSIADERLGRKHLITTQIVTALADVLNEQGAIDEAKSLYEDALSIGEQLFEPQSLQSLKLRFRATGSLAFGGNYGEALRHWNEILEIQKDEYGSNHPDTLKTLTAIAGLWMIKGRYVEAKNALNEIAMNSRQSFGDHHPIELDSRAKLATIAGLEGKIPECRDGFQSTLNSCEQAFGTSSPITVEISIAFAESLDRSGFHAEAQSRYDKLFITVKEVFGSNHATTLRVMDSMATALSALARHDEAKQVNQQLLDLRSKNLGEYHPLTLRSANNLGCCLLSAGNLKESEALIRKAVDASRERFGADFPATLQYTQNLATLLSMQKQSDEPIELFRDVIARLTRNLDPEHVEVLVAKSRYAAALSFQKRFHEAKDVYEQLLSQYRRSFGNDHPNTLICMDNLASVHGAIGEFDLAIRLEEENVAISLEKYPSMAFTLKAVHALIEYRILAKQPLASARDIRNALELHKIQDVNLDWMVNDLQHVAYAHLAANELDESVRLVRELISISDSRLGPTHLTSLVNKVRLAELLDLQKNTDEAKELIEFAQSSLAARMVSSTDSPAFNSGLERLKASLINRHQEVAEIADVFAEKNQWMIAAGIYSRCAQLVYLNNERLTGNDSESNSADEASGFTNQAIAMMRNAAAQRAISNPRLLEWLKISPNFEWLRSTAEFGEILESVDRQLRLDSLTRVAWSLARSGEHDRARQIADTFASMHLEGIEESVLRFNQACIYSRCYESERLSDDTSMQYLQLAIGSLKECARLGLFDAGGVSRLNAEIDLDPIRQTEDFKVFLNSLCDK